MSTGLNWKKLSGALILGVAVLCAGSLNPASAVSEQVHNKKTKKPQSPPVVLQSGPTGPVQQVPLDSIAAVPPQVTYENNQLTIIAPNSTLADILRAVRKQTGAEIEIPSAPDRVATHLGPGPARDVVAELLNGSRFNYVLLGSPADDAALTRVVLVAKTGPQDIPPPQPTLDPSLGPQANNVAQQPEQMPEAEAESADDNSDDNADQSADDQQQAPQDQPAVKTPQQMLQEMQQRQMQLQQAQPPGQPPVPGPGRPPGTPQQQNQ